MPIVNRAVSSGKETISFNRSVPTKISGSAMGPNLASPDYSKLSSSITSPAYDIGKDPLSFLPVHAKQGVTVPVKPAYSTSISQPQATKRICPTCGQVIQ